MARRNGLGLGWLNRLLVRGVLAWLACRAQYIVPSDNTFS
jgi:hypothetical protein